MRLPLRTLIDKPNQTELAAKGWIPTSATDVIQNPIEVLSRDPDNPNFLRPATCGHESALSKMKPLQVSRTT